MASKKESEYLLAVTELNAQGHKNTTEEQLKQMYRKFAQDYDKELQDNDYSAPRSTTIVFHKSLGLGKENIRILDVGCGTGLVGEQLRDLGYTNIDGLDLSQEMLDIAIKKGVYKKTYCDFFAKDHTLPILDGEYDAIISVGTITLNHVKADAFDEIIRLVKSGGIICFTIRIDTHTKPQLGYIDKFSELVKDKKWELVSEEPGRYCETTDHIRVNELVILVYKIL